MYTLYTNLYIRMKAWYDAENWLEKSEQKIQFFKVIFVIFCYNKKD